MTNVKITVRLRETHRTGTART